MLFQYGFVTASLLHIDNILFTGNPSFLISLFYFILNYSFHEKLFFQLDRSLVRSGSQFGKSEELEVACIVGRKM